ncbi:MAG TPA: sodium ion-translocating decarboxylase subunit beta [Anaerolineaceae bacterium]|uniref:Sodium ion-translocating decarboxylase, beta subunit n=1 Tax=Anaerolinea thermophila TaxID=167964 RepID=A0A101FYQ7_9CHLR|nr:MAG: Sodium ion-translocating decarboxylase, beta subunit [Anaerolinea thermophila]HAF62890.1 sodium ion-translocating decarboxylase subunit beta [Anaerolineaceae bacterium]
MENLLTLFRFDGVDITWKSIIMILVGLVLIYLAIKKEYEPVLLLPIGFGCILANLGMAATPDGEGFLSVLYRAGIQTELFPLLIFVGVGGMIDFSPLLAQPKMALLGAAGQFGIFGTLILATWLGFDLKQAASIGSIGAIDGPTAIFVSGKLAPELLAPIAVAAYSYMSLVPIIQRPIMKLLTTRKERLIRMEYAPRAVSKTALIVFPIMVTIIVSLIAPDAAPLIAALMLGNLLRESGVVDRLNNSAQNEIINVSTLFLGLTIGGTMVADSFLKVETLKVLGLGLIAFAMDTVMGVLFGKLMCVFSGGKINPLIGACGISAFPMAGRLSAKMAQEEDFDNFILMHAMGANTGGQLASVIAGGLLLTLVNVIG